MASHEFLSAPEPPTLTCFLGQDQVIVAEFEWFDTRTARGLS